MKAFLSFFHFFVRVFFVGCLIPCHHLLCPFPLFYDYSTSPPQAEMETARVAGFLIAPACDGFCNYLAHCYGCVRSLKRVKGLSKREK